ncbi:S8 family serine peptidase [Buchananella hordeovulneris]|nr:S8 family serine peptidase [Buchananella hordeovulneris]
MSGRAACRRTVGVTLSVGLLLAGLGAPAHAAPAPSPSPAAQQCEVGVERLIADPPPIIAQLGMPAAWELSRGEVVVAVVDSGVASQNAHLQGDVVLPGLDLLDNKNAHVDEYGHGTAIAGQIAARQVEGSGLVGLAPAARILPVRVYQDPDERTTQAGRGLDVGRTAAGIRWAADNGAQIIVVALSTPEDHPALREAVEYADAQGALVVASTGNMREGEDPNAPRFPAGYDQALAVTAVDLRGLPSTSVVQGEHIDIAAPGMAVPSAFLASGDCIFAGDQPSSSYATGYAAGIAALVAGRFPHERPAQWKYRLLATASRATPTDHNRATGWGLISPVAALTFVNDGRLPGPANPDFAPLPSATPALLARPAATDLAPAQAQRHGALTIAGSGAAVTLGALLVASLVRRRRVAADRH